MTEKHYLQSWSYNEGRKLRCILRNIQKGNIKIVKVRKFREDSRTMLELEGELKIL